MVNFQEVNCDCLLVIISYLSLTDQCKLALCSKRFNSLCLSESTFKTHVKRKFPTFPHIKIYAVVKSWKLTAKYFHELVHPVEILVYEVLPQWIFRLSKGYIWTDLLPGSTIARLTLQETIYLVECYQTVYRDLILVTPGETDTFWDIMFPAWKKGDQTILWDHEPEYLLGRPPGHFVLDGWNNLGCYIRCCIQSSLEREATGIVDHTIDILGLPRSLPSIRTSLLKVISMNIHHVHE